MLLCLLFLGYYGSTTLFYHVHVEPGGAIVHSHPIWNHSENAAAHHHSRAAYQTIQQLSHVLLVAGWTALLPPLFRTVYARLQVPPIQQTAEYRLEFQTWRAPPVR